MAAKHVRILGRNYRLTAKAESDRAFGSCDNIKGLINVSPGQEQFSKKDTLLHEILHGILFMQGYTHNPELEEAFVRPLATGILAVMRDNPGLADKLFTDKRL